MPEGVHVDYQQGAQRVLAPAPGIDRHVIDEGVVHHGRQGRLDVLRLEFALEMLVPQELERRRHGGLLMIDYEWIEPRW